MLLVSVLGLGQVQATCDQCLGHSEANVTCGLVSGLYTKPHLPPGLNHVTKIPVGACSLNISLLKPHNNHLGK